MLQYLIFLIIGIILYILLNRNDGFSVGGLIIRYILPETSPDYIRGADQYYYYNTDTEQTSWELLGPGRLQFSSVSIPDMSPPNYSDQRDMLPTIEDLCAVDFSEALEPTKEILESSQFGYIFGEPIVEYGDFKLYNVVSPRLTLDQTKKIKGVYSRSGNSRPSYALSGTTNKLYYLTLQKGIDEFIVSRASIKYSERVFGGTYLDRFTTLSYSVPKVGDPIEIYSVSAGDKWIMGEIDRINITPGSPGWREPGVPAPGQVYVKYDTPLGITYKFVTLMDRDVVRPSPRLRGMGIKLMEILSILRTQDSPEPLYRMQINNLQPEEGSQKAYRVQFRLSVKPVSEGGWVKREGEKFSIYYPTTERPIEKTHNGYKLNNTSMMNLLYFNGQLIENVDGIITHSGIKHDGAYDHLYYLIYPRERYWIFYNRENKAKYNHFLMQLDEDIITLLLDLNINHVQINNMYQDFLRINYHG